jgi:chemotaxis protein histidine kinase CheA
MSDDAFAQALKELSAEYRASLPVKLASLERLWDESAASIDALRDLRREFHTIAGAAKTFGVAGLTDAARAAEEALGEACDHGGSLDRGSFEPLLDAVRKAAA